MNWKERKKEQEPQKQYTTEKKEIEWGSQILPD